ncbi:MAG: hypothetical protein HC805_05635 [Alkalinema sp. RL_2_19]|nr:hypothetical protein [Alkalinema sp. RL_2_19]
MFGKRRYWRSSFGGCCIGSLLCCVSPAIAAPEITAIAATGATQLPLNDSGGTPIIQKAADVQVSTIASSGLTLSVTPESLTKVDGSSIAIQFLIVADGAGQPSSTAFITDANSTYSFSTGTAGTDNFDLYIKYTPAQFQDPGNYATTIQLTVEDNP